MSYPENTSIEDNENQPVDYIVDARGLRCPMPLLKMKQALNSAKNEEVVLVKATDPASERDISAYIAMTSHHLFMKKIKSEYFYWVTKNQQD